MATKYDRTRSVDRLVVPFEAIASTARQVLDRVRTGHSGSTVSDQSRRQARHDTPMQSDDDDREKRPLLTPEERVASLLDRNGGVMQQNEIVSSVEWSESTVSRRLSELESTGAISRYQIGRRKVVYLPEHEPAALKSPLAPTGAD